MGGRYLIPLRRGLMVHSKDPICVCSSQGSGCESLLHRTWLAGKDYLSSSSSLGVEKVCQSRGRGCFVSRSLITSPAANFSRSFVAERTAELTELVSQICT